MNVAFNPSLSLIFKRCHYRVSPKIDELSKTCLYVFERQLVNYKSMTCFSKTSIAGDSEDVVLSKTNLAECSCWLLTG